MKRDKVLCLDTDRCLHISMTRALSREGYHVTVVSSVEKAVKTTKHQSHDLLIVIADRPELLNMLLARFPPELTVLIITPESMVSEIIRSSGTGIHSFLVKPFSLDKFKDTVAQTIDRARLVKEDLRSKTIMTLEHINHLLTSEVEMEKFFKLVVEISATNTKADYVSLLIRDEVTGELRIKAQIGAYKSAWENICQLMPKTEQILFDETTKNHPRLHKLITGLGISAMLRIPLMVEGDLIGTINHIKLSNRTRFTPGDLSFASILGRWSSRIIEKARFLSLAQQQHLHLEKLLHEISLAQGNERKRLAFEIHDGATQWMIGASYRINACSTLVSQSKFSDLKLELGAIEKTLQRSVKELRRIIADLHPLPLEKLGLVAAIQQTMETLNEDGIRCYLKVDETLPTLTLAQESSTYWILQEALTNIRKHSGATEIHLRLHFSDGIVLVDLRDNGRGFNLEQVMNSKIILQHIGLISMKERAELLGGRLVLSSNLQKGTSIGFSFPVSSRLTKKIKAGR